MFIISSVDLSDGMKKPSAMKGHIYPTPLISKPRRRRKANFHTLSDIAWNVSIATIFKSKIRDTKL